MQPVKEPYLQYFTSRQKYKKMSLTKAAQNSILALSTGMRIFIFFDRNKCLLLLAARRFCKLIYIVCNLKNRILIKFLDRFVEFSIV